MTLTEVQHTLRAIGLRPSRRMGQNFLIDGNILAIIIEQAQLTNQDHVLEIGAGLGVLTRALLQCSPHVVAIEKDKRLCAYLRQQLPALELIEGDAITLLDAGLPLPDHETKVVANLPYAISTPVLERLVEGSRKPCRMVLLLQREVADRLAAQPRTKAYGALSLYTRLHYHPSLVHVVSARCFYPRPHVESAIVLLERRRSAITPPSDARFRELVRTGFSQRRKMLRKLLAGYGDIDGALRAVDASPNARAEELDLEQWVTVTSLLT